MAKLSTLRRINHKANSNNTVNPNQNICAQRVAQYIGVSSNVRYLHTYEDLLRASRTQWSTRSRLSQLGKNPTVGGSRAKLSNIMQAENALGAIIMVKGHVLFMDRNGKTIVDTAPRKRDARSLKKVHLIFPK
jgi:hypothetical protein